MENKKIFTKTNTTITIITIILFAIKFIEMVVLYEDSYPAIHIYNTISLIFGNKFDIYNIICVHM